MAWNPSPKVAEARDYARRHGLRQVIVLELSADGLGYTSYGRTRAECEDARRLADVAYEAVMADLESR